MIFITRMLAGLVTLLLSASFAIAASEIPDANAPVPAGTFENCTPTTIGGVLNNFAGAIGPVGYSLIGISIGISGIALVFAGLIGLTKESPQERRLPYQLARILGGSLMTTFAGTMNMASSIFGFEHTQNQYSMDALARAVSGCGKKQEQATDMAGALVNFLTDAGSPMMMLVLVMAFVSGMFYVGSSILGFIQNAQGNQQQHTIPSLLMKFGAGAMLINFGVVFTTIDTTLLGTGDIAAISVDGCSSLSYKNDPMYTINTQAKKAAECINGVRGGSPEDYATATINAIFVFLIPFGALSVLSGLWILANISNGKSQLGYKHAFTRIIAGAIMINMASYTCLLGNTLGITNTQSMAKYTIKFCK